MGGPTQWLVVVVDRAVYGRQGEIMSKGLLCRGIRVCGCMVLNEERRWLKSEASIAVGTGSNSSSWVIM